MNTQHACVRACACVVWGGVNDKCERKKGHAIEQKIHKTNDQHIYDVYATSHMLVG